MRKILTVISAFLIMLTLLAAPAAQAFDLITPACKANSSTPNSPICGDAGTTRDPVVHVISAAANLIAVLAGLAAVIMIIISGISMITSSGNSDQVTNARKRLVNAAIGLALVILAWTITRFVVDRVLQ